jgi:Bacterial PH domain
MPDPVPDPVPDPPSGPTPGRVPHSERLYAPFRPRLARTVSIGFAVAMSVATVAFVIPLWGYFGTGSGVGVLLLGFAIAWFCWREASVRAEVDERGITVRNLVVTRRLEWAQVVAVRFGQGRPWAQLDLSDGDVLAVMGIQQSDGDRAAAESRRLAALVAIHSRTSRND